jgi:hypothetical protein
VEWLLTGLPDMKTILLTVLIVLSVMSIYSQTKISEQIFSDIDALLRRELVITLESFIKSYKSQDWAKLYSFFSLEKV